MSNVAAIVIQHPSFLDRALLRCVVKKRELVNDRYPGVCSEGELHELA